VVVEAPRFLERPETWRIWVTDKRVLALIRLFLAAGVMRELGSVTATPSGAPQGSSLSPLLSNIALSVLDRHFEAAWAARTHDQRARDRAPGPRQRPNDPFCG
jgi:RNA-directed DNA polymerase